MTRRRAGRLFRRVCRWLWRRRRWLLLALWSVVVWLLHVAWCFVREVVKTFGEALRDMWTAHG